MPQLDICQSCFKKLNGGAVCPHCGFDYTKAKKYGGALPPFTILHNKYLVGRVLGKGGFGITYAAGIIVNNQIVSRVAIKEFMPSEYSSRSDGNNTVRPFNDDKSNFVFNHGKEKYVEEAQTLMKLKSDPIVVDIIDYFQENNTAYIVMEYLDGQDLGKMAKDSGGKIDPDFAKQVFVTIASSLMEIHKLNILHRDLSPDNIYYTKSGQIKLIDFGAARNYVSTQNKGMSILLKPGFAPPEQYNAKGNQGTWSDVYALCATFYKLVSGKPLIDALFRYRGQEQPSLYSLGCNVTKKTSDVIEKGMALEVKDRYKNFMEVLNDIDIDVTPAKPAPQPVKQVSQQQYQQAPPVQQQYQQAQPVQQQYQQAQPVQQQYQQAQPVQQQYRQAPPVQQQYQQAQPVQQQYRQAPPVQQYQQAQPVQQQYRQAPPVQQYQQAQPVQQQYRQAPPVQQQYQQAQPVQQQYRQAPPVQQQYQQAQPVQQQYRQAPPVQQQYQQVPPLVRTVTQNQAQQPVQHNNGMQHSGTPYVAAIIGGSLHQKMTISDKIKIGRSRLTCQFAIENDSNISREHCYVKYDGRQLYLADTSSNGTFFENGTRLIKGREYPINPGTKFYIATRNHMLVADIQR